MSNAEEMELRDRLNLIESMIAEGRRKTESWGWTFVLWGVAYYVAIAWSYLGQPALAWPVTMVAASILTGVLASRTSSKTPETTIGRSMMAIWVSVGASLFLLMMFLSITGRMEIHIGVAIVGGLLGMANATSSIILRWKMQFACALVWWATMIAALFVSEAQAGILFLVALFFCQIVFGIYGMIRESQRDRAVIARQGASHA
jgi:hypothetical protein